MLRVGKTQLRSRWWPLVLLGMGVALVSSAQAAEVRGRVVNAQGEGIAQAVVFVQEPTNGVAGHPETRVAVMDQVNKQFVPALLPITVGTEVRFPNHDQIHHHVYSFSRTKSFDLPLYKGETVPAVHFDTPGVVKVGCNIHDWMSGIILILPSPYHAVTDTTGTFVLSDLPAGTYALVCWHERSRKKVADTARQVHLDVDVPDVTFSLSLKPERKRRPTYGQRGY